MTAIEGMGTPESDWLPFLAGLHLPALDLSVVPRDVVVVAPHPDDEVLGVGGLIALLTAAGCRVRVLAVTDGEASHPGGSVAPAELAALRVAETSAALRLLALQKGPVTVTRLALPDGGGAGLEPPVLDALAALPADAWLLAPWAGDGHPDHEAVGRACVAAADRAGARLLAYPVWAWHWAVPGDSRLPWARARRVDLPAAAQRAKERAIDAFATQVRPLGPLPEDAPVLPEAVLMRFRRGWETVFA